MQTNPSDPLLKNGPEQQRLLYDALRQQCNGFPLDVVVGAAINLLVNGLRQSRPTRTLAEKACDEYGAKIKGLLMEHYDPITGKRRNIFPFTQVIQAALVEEPDVIEWRQNQQRKPS